MLNSGRGWFFNLDISNTFYTLPTVLTEMRWTPLIYFILLLYFVMGQSISMEMYVSPKCYSIVCTLCAPGLQKPYKINFIFCRKVSDPELAKFICLSWGRPRTNFCETDLLWTYSDLANFCLIVVSKNNIGSCFLSAVLLLKSKHLQRIKCFNSHFCP